SGEESCVVIETLTPVCWLVTSAARAIGSKVAEAPHPLTAVPPAASDPSAASAARVLRALPVARVPRALPLVVGVPIVVFLDAIWLILESSSGHLGARASRAWLRDRQGCRGCATPARPLVVWPRRTVLLAISRRPAKQAEAQGSGSPGARAPARESDQSLAPRSSDGWQQGVELDHEQPEQ